MPAHEKLTDGRVARLLAIIALGEPVAAAARAVGVSGEAVRQRAARDSALAGRLAAAQAAGGADPGRSGRAGADLRRSAPLGRAEWEELLAERCREGSVAALRVWREVHGAEVQPPAAQADELARLRALHAEIEARQ
jgi:hypothetical protein